MKGGIESTEERKRILQAGQKEHGAKRERASCQGKGNGMSWENRRDGEKKKKREKNGVARPSGKCRGEHTRSHLEDCGEKNPKPKPPCSHFRVLSS